jgi:LacI family fructose operon transcriptional repressor
MPRIKDVADAAGVSTATVSRVLSNKPHVRPELRERVLAAAERLNYRPSRVAQSLRTQQSNTIGLIVADIRNPYFTSVSRAVEDMAHEQTVAVFFCNSDENPEKEAMYLDLMSDENVAGIILAPTNRTTPSLVEIVDPDVPLVLIDRHAQGLETDTVLIDNTDSAYKLIEHLLADGHRRIGAMFGVGSTTGRERREGYTRALKDHGIELSPDLVRYVEAREEAGYKEAMRLMSLPVPPNAIFASNGLLSAGAFRAIRERGLTVPDELAFAAFDNTTWTSLVSPAITVIEQPTYEIGEIAADLLFKRIEDPSRPVREVTLKGKLLVRQSCGRHE